MQLVRLVRQVQYLLREDNKVYASFSLFINGDEGTIYQLISRRQGSIKFLAFNIRRLFKENEIKRLNMVMEKTTVEKIKKVAWIAPMYRLEVNRKTSYADLDMVMVTIVKRI